MKPTIRAALVIGLVSATGWLAAAETVTYDGSLLTDGLPAFGQFVMRFQLYDGPDPRLAREIGEVIEKRDVEVWRGHFSVDLTIDRGAAEYESAWLEISVGRGDLLGGFTRLEPLQQLQLEPHTEAATPVPSGAVVFFNLTACPPGWTDHTDARGRVVVGLPVNGTLGGTIGTPLSNLETRQHNHSFAATNPTVTDAGYHNHIWSQVRSISGDVHWETFRPDGAWELAFVWGNGIDNSGEGTYPFAGQPDSTFYTSKGGTHKHQVTLGPGTTGSTSSNLPYVQLLACRKD